MMTGMKGAVLIVVMLGVAGIVFLANWDIPAPTKTVTKTLTSEQISK
jgi:hypothetical protein